MADLLALIPDDLKQSYPALQPPEGVESNFDNPESRGYIILTVGSLLFALMAVFMAIRLYVRFFMTRHTTWGDVTCIFAALGATAYFITQIIAVNTGSLGKHLWDIRIIELGDAFFITNAFLSVILVNPTLMAAKLTLFSLYHEIFHPFKWMRICIYIGISVTSVFYVAASIAQIVLTTPRKGEGWLMHSFSKDEYASQTNGIPFASVGLGIDVFLLVLPIKAVMDLHLSLKRKMAVSLVFLTGLLACLASSLSIWLRVGYNHTSDVTWAAVNVILTALAEMNIGVIVACMPAASKLFYQNLPHLKALQLSFRSSQFRSTRKSEGITKEYGSTKASSANASSQLQIQRDFNHNDSDHNPPLLNGYQKMDSKTNLPYELNNLKSVSTYIRSENGPSQELTDNQIHLKKEFWQVK